MPTLRTCVDRRPTTRSALRRLGVTAAALPALLGGVVGARAQDIEPRAYSNAPIGVHFLIAGTVLTRGGLSFDPSVPITNARLSTSNLVLAYATVFELAGQSAKLEAIVPYARLEGTAEAAGQPVQRDVSGFSDSALRLSVNLAGAPALKLKEFAGWQQDLIVGASLRVTAPTSQYDPARLVNIGTNRWTIKPEVGVSKATGPLTVEFAAAVTFYTDNGNFYGGNTRSQDPLVAAQGHLIYGFRSGVWTSLDGTVFAGGRTMVNGTMNSDMQQNWRLGATLALPIDRQNSVKFYASSGLSARTGNNYDLLGVAWQYRWGGGL